MEITVDDSQEIREAPSALAGTTLGGLQEPGINQRRPETARKDARSRAGPLPAAAQGQPRDDIKPPLASLRPSSAWHNGQRRHAGVWGVWTPEIAESHLPRAFYISILTAPYVLEGDAGFSCNSSSAYRYYKSSSSSESCRLLLHFQDNSEKDRIW